MTRTDAVRKAVDDMCFATEHSMVVDYIEEKNGNVLHWLDLCELIIQPCPAHGFQACFAATVEADNYVKSL